MKKPRNPWHPDMRPFLPQPWPARFWHLCPGSLRPVLAGRQGSWLFLAVGSVASAVGNWYLVWLLARTAPQQMLGAYALAVAWVVPVFALCSLQLRPLQASESKSGQMADAYWQLRLLGLLAASFSVLTAASYVADATPLRWLLLLVALPRAAEMLSDYSYGVRTRRAAFREVGASQLIRSVLSMAAITLLWLADRPLWEALLAGGLTSLVLSVWLDGNEFLQGWRQSLRSLRRLRSSRAREALRALLTLALPLTLVAFLNAAVISLPRILLGRSGLLNEVAILACVMSLLVIPGLLAASYAASQAPRFACAFREGGLPLLAQLVTHSCQRVFLASAMMSFLIVIFGNPVLRFVFGDGFAVSIASLVAAALFTIGWSVSAVCGTATTAARRIRPQVVAFAAASITCLCLGLLLIPAAALTGALWSLAVASLVLLGIYQLDQRIVVRRASRTGMVSSATRALVALPACPCRPEAANARTEAVHSPAERGVAHVCRL